MTAPARETRELVAWLNIETRQTERDMQRLIALLTVNRLVAEDALTLAENEAWSVAR